MVAQRYRWDFIGLSTDTKPTKATSDKVANGSTYYESDTSKLYVFYGDQWYEKTATGGGGTTYTAGDGIDITSNTISVDTDTIQEKLTAGTNITIDEDNVISASGGGSVTPVQVPGNSTTDIMSQDATTKMVFDDPTTQANVKIGNGAAIGPNLTSNNQVSIGKNATIEGKGSNIAIGAYSSINNKANTRAIAIGGSIYKDNSITIGGTVPNGASDNNVAIGFNSSSGGSSHTYSVALGNLAECTRSGEVNVGTGGNNYGYNSTKYRVIGGVHDGQLAQDAVTVAQVNATIDAINTALSTNIPHIGATS